MGGTQGSAVREHPDRAERDRHTQELLEEARQASPPRAEKLREQAVLINRSMALGLARQFDHRGMERDDLHQVALMGLVQAVKRYRPDEGSSFAAFAVPTIRGVLKRHFRDHGWSVRPPRALQDLHSDVRACTLELAQELGCEPSVEQVSEHLGVPVEDVRRARSVEQHYRSTSLDAPAGPGADAGTPLKDRMSTGADPAEDALAYVLLRDALSELDDQERWLLRMRFYEDLTQREIGYRLNVSQMQVSRLLRRLFSRLRTVIDGEAGATRA